jgi:hypothetical protein
MEPDKSQSTQAPDGQASGPSVHGPASDVQPELQSQSQVQPRPQPQPQPQLQPHARPQAFGPAEPDHKVFRLPGALVAWWAWLVLAVACLVDLAVSGRDHTSAEIAVSVALITGIMYACALRPMVIADSAGITVRNPLRDHKVPWGSVTAVDLGESVRVHCASEPGTGPEKIIHSWALYAQRRSRIRADLMEQRARTRSGRGGFAADSRLPAEAQRLARQPTAQIMAGQLDDLAAKARARGAAAGPVAVTWAWQSAVAIAPPLIALVLVITLIH